jgi:hypothetical protein
MVERYDGYSTSLLILIFLIMIEYFKKWNLGRQLSELGCTVEGAAKLLAMNNYTGTAIPRRVVQFWTGGAMDDVSMGNVLEWKTRCDAASWQYVLYTFSETNGSAFDAMTNSLKAEGVVVKEYCPSPLATEAIGALSAKYADTANKYVLAFLCDIARADLLVQQGGLYVDVDVNPGDWMPGEDLHLRDEQAIPLLAPVWRTAEIASNAGYFGEATEKAEAVLSCYAEQSVSIKLMACEEGNECVKEMLQHNAAAVNNEGHVGYGAYSLIVAINKVCAANSGSFAPANLIRACPPFALSVRWVTGAS